jgi:hypothetical protein
MWWIHFWVFLLTCLIHWTQFILDYFPCVFLNIPNLLNIYIGKLASTRYSNLIISSNTTLEFYTLHTFICEDPHIQTSGANLLTNLEIYWDHNPRPCRWPLYIQVFIHLDPISPFVKVATRLLFPSKFSFGRLQLQHLSCFITTSLGTSKELYNELRILHILFGDCCPSIEREGSQSQPQWGKRYDYFQWPPYLVIGLMSTELNCKKN